MKICYPLCIFYLSPACIEGAKLQIDRTAYEPIVGIYNIQKKPEYPLLNVTSIRGNNQHAAAHYFSASDDYYAKEDIFRVQHEIDGIYKTEIAKELQALGYHIRVMDDKGF